MSDLMLHGVLCMPPELWQDSEIDKRQRYARYLAASRRIEDADKEITRLTKQRDELVDLMNQIGEINRVKKYDIEITKLVRAALAKVKQDEVA
jgi:hypothetical protein